MARGRCQRRVVEVGVLRLFGDVSPPNDFTVSAIAVVPRFAAVAADAVRPLTSRPSASARTADGRSAGRCALVDESPTDGTYFSFVAYFYYYFIYIKFVYFFKFIFGDLTQNSTTQQYTISWCLYIFRFSSAANEAPQPSLSPPPRTARHHPPALFARRRTRSPRTTIRKPLRLFLRPNEVRG